eukprot:TRINITY_DN2291_c0_g1_i1.p1 TRINITY_DN2291_c0_g1~~TRINITY_DN2291_c0_g1_i1.p1  ORF type:complete len:100 (-),score=26.52 TRINITY_DN2291_c0_g1_i1:51-350(-)
MSEEYVVLVSKEGFEFFVDSKIVSSSTITNMLKQEGNISFVEAEKKKVTLDTISTRVLEYIIKYFFFRKNYSENPESTNFQIPDDIVMDVLVAANYLDC